MVLKVWDNISYMVQLLIACFIFLLPAIKKRKFWLRVCISALCGIVITFILNGVFDIFDHRVLSYIYWVYHIIICFLVVYIGLGGSWKQSAYCTACACAMQHIAFDLYLIYKLLGGDSSIVFGLIYIITYSYFYFLFAKDMVERGEFTFNRNSLFPIITIISVVWILSIMEDSQIPAFSAAAGHRIIYRLIDGLCCFYVLWVQVSQSKNINLQRKLNEIRSMWKQKKKQYEVTSATIENINRKSHDLKHQIQAIKLMTDKHEMEEFLSELENDIMIYDTAMNTGNKALDIVLMETGLMCKNNNIHWSCIADGHKLNFMKSEDIYAIFGNAFDNAIAAVMELANLDKRVITAKMIQQNQLFTIQVQNYFDKQLKFEGGLPKTTKNNKNDHGYGMKSIRYIAEKYNGTITIKVDGDIFILQIFIPTPSEK